MLGSQSLDGPYTQLLLSSLPDSRKQNPVPPLRFSFAKTQLRFVRFQVLEFWGKRGGLQFFEAALATTSHQYLQLPGQGWCTDQKGAEGKARYFLKAGSRDDLAHVCDQDPKCVAFAFSSTTSSALYSSGPLCTRDCGQTQWTDQPSLIVGTSGDSRYSCSVKRDARRTTSPLTPRFVNHATPRPAQVRQVLNNNLKVLGGHDIKLSIF